MYGAWAGAHHILDSATVRHVAPNLLYLPALLLPRLQFLVFPFFQCIGRFWKMLRLLITGIWGQFILRLRPLWFAVFNSLFFVHLHVGVLCLIPAEGAGVKSSVQADELWTNHTSDEEGKGTHEGQQNSADYKGTKGTHFNLTGRWVNNASEESTLAYLLRAPIREWHVFLMGYCNLLMIYRTQVDCCQYMLVLLVVYDHDDDNECQQNSILIINDEESVIQRQ